MKRATFLFLLKALISLGLLLFLLSQIDIHQFLQVLSSAHLSYLFVALAVYFFGQIACSFRWMLLARPLGFENPFKDFTIFYFIGMFFNLFAPSTVGGDVGRVFYLARGGTKGREEDWKGPTVSALVSVIADRAIGLIVLVWIGAGALIIFSDYPLPQVVRYLTIALALGSFLAWFLMPFVTRLLQERAHTMGRSLALALETYWSHRQVLAGTIALSFFVHCIQAWMQVVLGWSLDLEIPWSYSLILYPLVGVFSALPISLNGIGLREGGYLFLLQLIDVSSEKAIAFGLLWFIIVALDSLIGGVVFIVKKSPKPSAILPDVGGQTR